MSILAATSLPRRRMASVVRAWRERPLLPMGPDRSGPWAGSDGIDRDRDRVRADLRAARRVPVG